MCGLWCNRIKICIFLFFWIFRQNIFKTWPGVTIIRNWYRFTLTRSKSIFLRNECHIRETLLRYLVDPLINLLYGMKLPSRLFHSSLCWASYCAEFISTMERKRNLQFSQGQIWNILSILLQTLVVTQALASWQNSMNLYGHIKIIMSMARCAFC